MTPRQSSVRARVDAARTSVHRDLLIALGGIAGAVIPIVLLIGWIFADATGWGSPSPAPLLVELVALVAALGLVRFGIRRWLSRATHAHIASAAENELGLPEGSVRGVLEIGDTAPHGASSALARFAEASLMPHVGDADVKRIAGDLGRRARRRRARATIAFAALSVAVVVAAFSSPARSRAAWSPLLNPVSHLTPPPLPPLVLEPGNIEVPRGSSLDVRVRAPGREAVLLQWRAEGDVLHGEPLTIGDGSGEARIESIDAPMRYWVRAPDGAISDTFRITPIDPLLVSDLTIDIVYPSYISRPAERFEGELPSLEVPQGTQLVIRGRATRALSSALLVRDSSDARVTLNVEDAQFSGRWVPTASGTYTWAFAGLTGAPAELSPAPFDLTVVPDAPPSVAITFPGTDTILGPELMQSIVADATDDHGILTATLVSWKTGATGVREKDVEMPVTLEGESDHAIVRGLIDARVRNLMPGDVLSYYVRITDNSPARQTAVSETYTLRLPSVEELRENSSDETNKLLQQMDELTRQAAELEKLTHDANRRAASASRRNAQGGRGNGSSGDKQMDFEQAEQARQILERQERVAEQAGQMSKQLEAIQRAMEAAGLQDPELQERLEEMRELYQKLVTPEMKKQMEQLRQALEQLDPEEVRRQMEALAQQQEKFREQLERSLEMMRRAAAEQELNSLSQQAKELATQQQALSEEMKQGGEKAEQAAEKQKEIEQKTNKLIEALAKLQQKLNQQGMGGAAQKTGEAGDQAKQAEKDMQRAAEQASNKQGEEASQAGQQAAEKLNETAQSLEQTRQDMAQSASKEQQEAMDQATSDALSLAQKQNELLQRMQKQMSKQGGNGEEQSQEGQKMPRPGDMKPNMPQAGSQQQQGQQGGQQGKQPQMGGKGGQQQDGKQQGGQQGKGKQEGGQQQGGKDGGKQQGGQGGQQKGGDQQGGQSGQQGGRQSGQQSGGQPQGAKQQNGQQQGGQQQGGQQQGGQQQGGQQQGGQQQGGQQQGGQQQNGQQSGDGNDASSIRSEQQALKQGLEQLGQNLNEMSQQAGTMNRDVGAALGRANLSMEQTLKALEEGRMPVQEAQKTLEDLNRLALALLNSSQQQGQGDGADQTMKQLQDLAQKQGSINGQTSSLAPLNLGQQAMADQMNRLSREQNEIAQKLGGMNNIGGREDVLGQLDALAKEAEQLARELAGGRLTPQTMARQERLFHKLLDAGRTLEREEYSDERKAERPGNVGTSHPNALRAELLDSSQRYPTPSAEQLKKFSPAMRRLILEYYDRLNRAAAAAQGKESAGR